MELIAKPYEDSLFVANIEDKALTLVMDAIEEIPNFDTSLVYFSSGVWHDVSRANTTYSIWVDESIDPILFRNRLYLTIIRMQVEDMISQGVMFDKDNVWYPIFRETSLLGDEWYRLFEKITKDYELFKKDYEKEPEYIVAKDLFDRYGKELKENSYYLYDLQLNKDNSFVDREESGWVLQQNGLKTLEEDISRLVLCNDEDAEEEDDYIFDNTDIDVDTMLVFG